VAVVSMSKQEFSRLEVLLRVQSGGLRVADACGLLDLRRRQVFRLLQGLKQDGATSLLSKHRGKPSNHRLPAEVRSLALSIVRERYASQRTAAYYLKYSPAGSSGALGGSATLPMRTRDVGSKPNSDPAERCSRRSAAVHTSRVRSKSACRSHQLASLKLSASVSQKAKAMTSCHSSAVRPSSQCGGTGLPLGIGSPSGIRRCPGLP
jgi:hypothetical protein